MRISSSFNPSSTIGNNRQLAVAAQPNQQHSSDSKTQAPLISSVSASEHNSRVFERINTGMARHQDIPLQSKNAVETYNSTANMGAQAIMQTGEVDLFA